MRPFRRRRRAARTSRFESFEPRLVMSGLPGQEAGELSLDYFVEDQAFVEVGTALADAHELTGLTEARREFGFTGEGQTVVIIDTGIAYDHLALGGGFGSGYRVVGGFDFTEEYDADPYDDGPLGSHGTHVAGIIASSDGTNPGVAPGVDLVALRVFNDDGQGYFNWIEDALQWVHSNLNTFENPITTVNLSLGTDYNADAPPSWATIEDELAQLEADGLFISVAAGNGFAKYSQPGLSYPAASPYVVPVASVDDNGLLSYFSQRSDRVIAAPGRSITSTVPDYLGNGNGIDDDFASYSGTSMAAPYVAGASVLLRQAFDFVGAGNVTQDALYGVMRSTADLIYDPATAQSYYRLNLQRALESIMPADDFGSYAYAAKDLGTLGERSSAAASRSISGTIGTLDDRDFFTFTAQQTGRVTFSIDVTHDLLPEWEAAGSRIVVDAAEGTMSLDVYAGQTYTAGLGTQAGLGHYTIDVRLEADFVPPGGTGPRQLERLDQSVSAAGQWFAFTAAQDGILTVEARFSNSQGDVDLELFDANQRLLGGSYTTGDVERIDVSVSRGDTTYVYAYLCGTGVNENVDFRMTNMVAQVGQTVRVTGTDGDDTFSFTAGSTHEIAVNGVSYAFDARAVHWVTFDGLGGSDTATLNGTAADDTATLGVTTAELLCEAGEGGPGYSARVTSVENITVQGRGGADVAYLYDSPGDDTFYAGDDEARLSGPGFSNRVVAFPYVHGYATAGGFDVAYLYDSPGDDVFLATPIYGKIYGDGFGRRAKLFEAVHAYATAGGHDAAYLFGSDGDDTFVSKSDVAKIFGNGYFNRAKCFEEIYGVAGKGGHDQAQLFDSALDDRLVASGDTARLSNASRAIRVVGFQSLDVSATSGGTDHAEIAAVDYLLRLLGDWQ